MLYCIDAGHMGNLPGLDCGSVGKFSKEADINLKFSKILGEKLKSKGETVIYTREGNLKQTTYQKAEIANKAKADRFISIHCNSFRDPNSNGVETYVCKGIEGETLELGKNVQTALVKSSGLTDRGLKEAKYDVLVKTSMPAILIELGFISNLNEEKLLNDDAWLDKVATAICKALVGEKGVDESMAFNVTKKTFKIPNYKADIIETHRLLGKDIVKRDNPSAMVNLALYDMTTHTNFMYLEDENKKHKNGYQGSKYGIGVKKDGTIIPCSWEEAIKSDDIKDFASASPTIMYGGKKCIDWGTLNSSYLKNNPHHRMMVAFKGQEVFLCSCNEKMSVEDCYTYSVQQGFTECFVYDGNGSQFLYADGKYYKNSVRQNVTWLQLFSKNTPIKAGEVRVVINGKESIGKLIDGVSYVPAKWVSESLGKSVEWNATTKTVFIK